MRTAISILVALIFASSVTAASHTATRFGDLETGIDPDSQRPDRILWNGKVVSVLEAGYVTVEKVFQLKDHDVALVSLNAGGSSSVSTYEFLLIFPDKSVRKVSDPELKPEDGTFEVSKSGETIEIDMGYGNGLSRHARLVGDVLTVSAKKSGKTAPVDVETCTELFSALSECALTQRKDTCSTGADVLSNAARSWFKVASQRPGFPSREFEAACTQACASGRVQQNAQQFKEQYCR